MMNDRFHLSRRIGRPVSRLVVLALEPVARVALLALALLVRRVAHLRHIAKGTTDPRVEFICIRSSNTNLDQISASESRLRINFSSKHQLLQ